MFELSERDATLVSVISDDAEIREKEAIKNLSLILLVK